MPDDHDTTAGARNVGGRPRVPEADRTVRMYIRLTPAEFDRLARKALKLEIPIARLVRQELRRVVP
jgi:hypothetical protein